jgi:serine/threonine protein kinase
LGGLQKTVIVDEIAEGMVFLHSRNVIHRDLKSLNILLDENNEPNICDFGLTRQVDQTMTGCLGTYHYMAPEVIESSRYDFKADVFSFGMLMWEIVKGQVPFSWFKQDHLRIVGAIRGGERHAMPKEASLPLRLLIKDCWAQVPEDHPTFLEIMQRMISEKICFPGAQQTPIKQFHTKKNPAQPATNDTQQVMALIRDVKWINTVSKFGHRRFQTKEDRRRFLGKLKISKKQTAPAGDAEANEDNNDLGNGNFLSVDIWLFIEFLMISHESEMNCRFGFSEKAKLAKHPEGLFVHH